MHTSNSAEWHGKGVIVIWHTCANCAWVSFFAVLACTIWVLSVEDTRVSASGVGDGWMSIWNNFHKEQYRGSAQPSTTQKEGINAPFLNCTSEVTQVLHLCIETKHFCTKIIEFGVKGVSVGLDLCHFPARKVGVEMRQRTLCNSGNLLSGHHLNVGSPSVCSQGKPCIIVWNAGGGPWWAATAETSKNIRLWSAPPSTECFDNKPRWTTQTKLSRSDLRRESYILMAGHYQYVL
jgi:hypothetical protein